MAEVAVRDRSRRRDREAVGSDRLARSRLSAIDLKQEKTFVQRTPQIRMPLCSRAAAMARQFVRPSLVAAILAFLLCAGPSFAQQGNEKTFASPGDAVLALYNAVKSSDSQALNSIFGASAGEILHTGDDVADKNTAAKFISHYEQMHRVVIEPDQSATLYLGAENWPFPISIVKNSSGAWYFDAEAGKKEILYRRIGTNENDAIDILHGLVDAQRDYASEPRDGDTTKHYALKFISAEGKHDGLYWKTSDDEAPSPIGPAIVSAASQGYSYEQGKQAPFHGYYYRILTKQGAAARGGARDYVVGGVLTRGFAFVAYPAQYRNSGVMTFIVNQDGQVYQKDLGDQTANLASAMIEYNPDQTWEKID
ncbi:MAG TPA: DUF2950 domain-containing protein [Silvibacterium sp.]|nr:DUF2950 domain-containing protein [Silvibacterium sp.]